MDSGGFSPILVKMSHYRIAVFKHFTDMLCCWGDALHIILRSYGLARSTTIFQARCAHWCNQLPSGWIYSLFHRQGLTFGAASQSRGRWKIPMAEATAIVLGSCDGPVKLPSRLFFPATDFCCCRPWWVMGRSYCGNSQLVKLMRINYCCHVWWPNVEH